MQQRPPSKAAQYKKRNHRRSIWKRVVGVLGCVVVFCTTYALILPAITKDNPVYCGLQEHTHSEECYEQAQRSHLVCSPETLDIHVHSDACVDAEGNNLCRKADYLVHTHGPSCNDADGKLICLLPEIGLHVHSDSCYDSEQGELICTQPQEEVHIHTDECFETVTEQTLVCELSEHSHNLACRADPEADLETAEDWTKAFGNAQLTGRWPEDIIAIAESQLGYTESEKNYIVLEDGETTKGYTRYGDWYGDRYGDWGAMFTAFCLEYAGVKNVPLDSDCDSWIEALSADDCGLYKSAQAHTPAPGDIVFLDQNGDGSADLTGIITELIPGEKTKLEIIAGDLNDQVQRLESSTDDAAILGYGDLNTAYATFRENVPAEKLYTDGSVTVKVTYLPSAGIPDDAELVVEKIQATDAYDSCYQEALEMLNAQFSDITATEITDFLLYDISFRYEGEEIEPTDKVSVEIISSDVELGEAEDVSVIHYAQNGAQLPTVQEYSVDEDGNLNTSFETESFSLFAIVTSQSSQTPIVSFAKYSITTSNIRSLPSGTAFAIVSGEYALDVDENGKLITTKLLTLENGNLSGHETVARWKFTRTNSSTLTYYYSISTTVNGTTYYLAISNNTLTLTTTQTNFTATRNNTNIRLASSSRYINLTASGVSTSSSAVNLSLYSVPTGEFEVFFDGQIGLSTYNGASTKKYNGYGTKRVTTKNGYVTLPTADEIKSPALPDDPSQRHPYQYTVNGWYDIVNQVYYDKSMLGQQVKVTCDTIFYPDYVATSYDIGQNENVITDQPDTRDFINTYVFDYNELFNIYSSKYSPSTGKWTFDPNSDLGFIFFDYLTDSDGNIGDMLSKDVSVNGVTVNMEKTNGTRGASTNFPGTITPGIATDERIKALFGLAPGEKLGEDEYQTMIGRTDLGEGDWLYDYDPDIGFYYYNSAKNAAAYNQSEQRFYVYDHTVHINSQNSLNDFLPFNYNGTPKTEYREKDTEANYWFGMKSEITFFLPYDSGSGKNIAALENDMQFRFSGDDDVWIFVDDQLVLDLGGVHDVVYGEINFSTGVTKTGQAISRNQIANNTAASYAGMPGVDSNAGTQQGVTVGTLPKLEGGREHTITVYYLERGSSLSNCAIYFNVAPSYKLQIEKQDKENNALLDGAEFQIFDDKACTVPSSLFLLDEQGNMIGEETNTFTAEHGVVTCWGMVPGRTYYIKETKPPTATEGHPGYPDMSSVVIQLYLGTHGGQNLVVLDSNDNEWVFAETTYFSTTEQLIQLRIYNEKFVGGDKKLYVEKVWDGLNSDEQSPIRVQVYANGEPTGRYLNLNKDNDWKGFFYSLPETDANGNEITYTVKEDVPSGFKVRYEVTQTTTSTTTQTEGWVPATALEDGQTYLLISNQGAFGTVSSSSELFRWTDASTALGQKKGNESTQWTATASGDGFTLRSGDGRYLKIYLAGSDINIYASPTSGTSANTYTANFNIDANGRLKADRYYFTQIRSDGKGSASTNANNGVRFTMYKWDTVETTAEETIPGWRVTNSPWTEIPVEKQWDDTVLETNQTEVTLTLYRVIAQSGMIDTQFEPRTLKLNAENNWADSFKDVPLAPDGSYYCVVEKTDTYKVTYSGETTSIVIDGKLHEVARVGYGSDGTPVTVTVTNSALFLLPETGGAGTTAYIMAGLALMIGAAFLMYITNKRRKEAAYS